MRNPLRCAATSLALVLGCVISCAAPRHGEPSANELCIHESLESSGALLYEFRTRTGVWYSGGVIGDLDSDGIRDFAAADERGVELYSGRRGAFLRELRPRGWLSADYARYEVERLAGAEGGAVLISVGPAGDGPHPGHHVWCYSDNGACPWDLTLEPVAGTTPRLHAAGDLDRDGVEDWCVAYLEFAESVHHADFNDKRKRCFGPGRIVARSGADGRVLWTRSGAQECDRFGVALAALGDVDGDGCADLACAADGLGSGAAVEVLSGTSGALLARCPVESIYKFPYWQLGAFPDRDGDGAVECVVQLEDETLIVAPRSGRILERLAPRVDARQRPHDEIGIAMDSELRTLIGDVDGDGAADLLGARDPPYGGLGLSTATGRDTTVGILYTLYSGASGRTLASAWHPWLERSHPRLEVLGDIDADGFSDFLLDDQARSLVVSGRRWLGIRGALSAH